MTDASRSIAGSGAFTFVAGLALWPPRLVYWEAVAAVVGDALTLALVAVAAIALGAAFAWTTGVGVIQFAIGAAGAYVGGMLAIEVLLSPDSPAHLLLYAGLAACLVGGVVGWNAAAGRLSGR